MNRLAMMVGYAFMALVAKELLSVAVVAVRNRR